MREKGLIDNARLIGYYSQIEPQLYRYPGIDPNTFRKAVEAFAS